MIPAGLYRAARAGLALLMLGTALAACDRSSAALAAVLTPAVPVATALAGSPQVERAYFGLHLHSAHAGIDWPTVPFGSWRLWDADVTWKDLQPGPGQWDFRRLDHDVELGRRHGVEMLLPLALTPRWASSRPDEASAYGPGHAAPPARIADWRHYVETVATRYRGRIAAYEIWNEPNSQSFFSGSVDEAVELTCAAREVLRRVDPAARLVSPSATHGLQGVRWLGEFLAAGGGRCVDVVGFHFYTLAHEPPEAMIDLAGPLRALLAQHRLADRPLWNTEAGWYIRNKSRPLTVRWHSLDGATSSAYVARALLLGAGLGLGRFHWYAWDDGNLGLFELEDHTPKAAARAYATVARWLDGARGFACDPPASARITCRFDREGRRWHLAWRTAGEEAYTPPADWRTALVVLLDGQRRPVQPGEAITLGAAPILFETRAAGPGAP